MMYIYFVLGSKRALPIKTLWCEWPTQGPYLDTCLGCFSGCPCLIMNRQLMLCYIMFIFIFSSENGFVNVLYSFQFSIVLGSYSEESQLYCIVLYCIEIIRKCCFLWHYWSVIWTYHFNFRRRMSIMIYVGSYKVAKMTYY